ncbi:hypothetical protein [Magnetospirillum sp. UT-4]|nr:hypothetical protein [Magnetospirillum sp. UT-4]CAA7620691.1 hypothetical protein MTBUT4_370009 [Magnetospirillum sp. UT-4]
MFLWIPILAIIVGAGIVTVDSTMDHPPPQQAQQQEENQAPAH